MLSRLPKTTFGALFALKPMQTKKQSSMQEQQRKHCVNFWGTRVESNRVKSFWIYTVAIMLLTAQMATGQGRITLNFEDVSIRDFIKAYSASTNTNYVIGPNVEGKVNVFSNEQLTFAQADLVFEQILRVNGLIIRVKDGFKTIVAAANSESLPDLGSSTSIVIRVDPSAFDGISESMNAVIPGHTSLTRIDPYGLSVLIVANDQAERAREIVDRIQMHTNKSVHIFKLDHAKAGEVLAIINSIGLLDSGDRISQESKSNALVLFASERVRSRIENLLSTLDSAAGQLDSKLFEVTHSNPNTIANIIQQSFGSDIEAAGLRLVANEETSTIFVRAPVLMLPEIERSIRALDRESDQVLIEAVIFELAIEDFSDISVQFGGTLNGIIAGGVQFTGRSQPPLASMVSALFSNSTPPIASGSSVGLFDRRSGGDSLAALLGALATKASSNIIATPSILTLNNQRAEMVVAQNVPFVTGSYTAVGDASNSSAPFQTISRQDVGLVLRVQPRISRSRQVRLAIEQEISNLTDSAAAAGGEITSKRSIKTTVIIGDGEIAVLGGLLEESTGDSNSGVPKLSELPLIGSLFSSNASSKSKRVLLLMIRPQVVTDPIELARVSQQLKTTHRNQTGGNGGAEFGEFDFLKNRSLEGYYKRYFRDIGLIRNDPNWPNLPPRISLEVLKKIE